MKIEKPEAVTYKVELTADEMDIIAAVFGHVVGGTTGPLDTACDEVYRAISEVRGSERIGEVYDLVQAGPIRIDG